ncbi:MAG: zinc dependent phospholipase C family protein [Clostridiaceae bacterium]|nr:zinc dependent phospholipase C family protein [Clostridiaceae bacterium]
MPLPMVHLCAAREYAGDKAALLNCPEFYLGCISPDAVHMRKNAGKQDKHVTHLHAENSDQWKRNVIEFIRQNRSKVNYAFRLGYGIHILTDILWNETLYEKFRTEYEKDIDPVQDVIWAYYNDTDQLDFELYKTFGWRGDVWMLLEKTEAPDIEGILGADEIDAWNKRTLHWYDSSESQHKFPVKYLSAEDIIGFAKTAGKQIADILAQGPG